MCVGRHGHGSLFATHSGWGGGPGWVVPPGLPQQQYEWIECIRVLGIPGQLKEFWDPECHFSSVHVAYACIPCIFRLPCEPSLVGRWLRHQGSRKRVVGGYGVLVGVSPLLDWKGVRPPTSLTSKPAPPLHTVSHGGVLPWTLGLFSTVLGQFPAAHCGVCFFFFIWELCLGGGDWNARFREFRRFQRYQDPKDVLGRRTGIHKVRSST